MVPIFVSKICNHHASFLSVNVSSYGKVNEPQNADITRHAVRLSLHHSASSCRSVSCQKFRTAEEEKL